MTKKKDFKRRVREHMVKTGKSYTGARSDLRSKAGDGRLTFRDLTYEALRLTERGMHPLAQETRRYAVERDILVKREKGHGGERFWSRTLPLSEGFGICLWDDYSPLDGFGLIVQKSGSVGFSHEWFTPESADVFRKLQGSGRVRLSVAKKRDSENLVGVTFLDDIVLRYFDRESLASEQPATERPPSHHVIVRKNSVFQVRPDASPEERYVFPATRVRPPSSAEDRYFPIVPETEGAEALTSCSLCGVGQAQARVMVAGPAVVICDRCVDSCARAGEVLPNAGAVISFLPAKVGPLVRRPDLHPRARPPSDVCQFCREEPSDARQLFVSELASICSECLSLCGEIMVSEPSENGADGRPSS